MALTQVPIELSSTPGIVDNSNDTAITIDSSENVGIGTSSPTGNLEIATSASDTGVDLVLDGNKTSNGGIGSIIFNNNGDSVGMIRSNRASANDAADMLFYTQATGGANSERMRIDSSGNVIIGGSTAGDAAADNLTLVDSGNAGMTIQAGDTSYASIYFKDSASPNPGYIQYKQGDDFMRFATGGSEAMRITSAGRIGIGLTPTYKLDVLNTTGNVILGRFTSTATSSTEYGPGIFLTNDPNNTTNYLLTGGSPSVNRFIIYSNGNIKNQNNSYTGISDEKLKENIVDAGSQWDDIKALRVRKYSFKEENASEPTQIGVIAQEVEAAGMSGLIYETVDQNTAEDGSIVDTGEVTKTMKYSILYMKAVKALQEAMTRIETLEAKVQQLENN